MWEKISVETFENGLVTRQQIFALVFLEEFITIIKYRILSYFSSDFTMNKFIWIHEIYNRRCLQERSFIYPCAKNYRSFITYENIKNTKSYLETVMLVYTNLNKSL